MVALAGLPPTAGFIAKFGVFYAAVKAGYVYLAAIGILAAIVSVYYYLRVVVYLYMPAPGPTPSSMRRGPMPALDAPTGFTLAVVVIGVIVLGVLPGGLLSYLASFMEG
jgi:NADH-quinone oxidoreductase subunit N